MWTVVLPLSFALSRFTDMSIYWLFVICQGCEFVKVIFGVFLLKRGSWVRQLVADESLKK
jgi:Na+-driven multidrug efflux pump